MEMKTKNWCQFHRINFDCDDWCPVCQEKLVEGLTNRCLTFLVPALMGTLNLSVIIQSVMPSFLSTDTKMTPTPKLDLPATQDASTETGKTKNLSSARTAENSEHIKTAHHLIRRTSKTGRSWGILFRWGSLWVGGHYSYKEKRYCINLLPCLTIWFTKPGGAIPYIA